MGRVQGMSNRRVRENPTPRNIIKFKNMKVRENSKYLQRKKSKINRFFNSNTGCKKTSIYNVESIYSQVFIQIRGYDKYILIIIRSQKLCENLIINWIKIDFIK